MDLRNAVKAAGLLSLLVVFVGIGSLMRGGPVILRERERDCTCPTVACSDAPQESNTSSEKRGGFRYAPPSRKDGKVRLLSYQPPGNGWNNQRIAVENALVLAKLLNRTLVVHPLSPHRLGSRLKAGRNPGYIAYNMLNATDLLPLSEFVDLDLMSEVVPVISVNTSHHQFLRDYSLFKWKNICHSIGFGYWVDQVPQNKDEVELLSRQKFTSIAIWREKCEEEQERWKRDPSPIVRYVSDLADDPAEMLYFEQGTLFGMQIRFTTLEGALSAENWVAKHFQYGALVWDRVERIGKRLGPYNAIHVRRNDHMDRKLPPSYWINRMIERNLSKALPLFIATDEPSNEWFLSFREAGFKIFFSSNFSDILDFSYMAESLQEDILGVHEQCLCERAIEFVASPASTFDAFILRNRGEAKRQDGLMVDTLHTFWIGHQTVKDYSHERTTIVH